MTDILAEQLRQIVRELTQSDVDENRTDYIYRMLDQISRRISHIFRTDEEVELLTQIHHLLVSIETEIFGQETITANFGITTLGVRGRPNFKVNMDQVMYLLSHGFKCPQISSMLGISLRTLRRRMSDDNISVSSCFVDMSNEELDKIVLEICIAFPGIGYRRLLGDLMRQGYRICHDRALESLRRVDPVGIVERWVKGPVSRRQYYVPGPLSLWHIDGNHKLIRFTLFTFLNSHC